MNSEPVTVIVFPYIGYLFELLNLIQLEIFDVILSIEVEKKKDSEETAK